MFRRKGEEDSLFDTTTIPNPAHAAESATVVTPPANSSSSGSSSGSSSSGSSGGSSAPAARSLGETRPTPTTSGFRPTANPLGDLTRGRMPEAKNAAAADKNKGARRVLTVGNDILLKGEIATCDRLVIEGKVDATLNDVHTVEIAEGGSFKGSAQIEDAEISGLFEGELVVRNRLVIYATGKVRGKISYGEIEIERGGELTGEIKMAGAQAGAARPARPAGAKEDKFAA